jgi:hypothetical protein
MGFFFISNPCLQIALITLNITILFFLVFYEIEQISQTASSQSLFKTNLHKDSLKVEDYYVKLNQRFQAACKCMRYLFIYCDEYIAKVRVNDIIQFLRRLFTFDFKKMVIFVQIKSLASFDCELIFFSVLRIKTSKTHTK